MEKVQTPILTVVHGEGVALDGSLVPLTGKPSSIQASSIHVPDQSEKPIEPNRCSTMNLKPDAHLTKETEYKNCTICGFDPVAFSTSIPNFDQKLQSQQFGIGEALEFWRGSLSTSGICWTCAH